MVGSGTALGSGGGGAGHAKECAGDDVANVDPGKIQAVRLGRECDGQVPELRVSQAGCRIKTAMDRR